VLYRRRSGELSQGLCSVVVGVNATRLRVRRFKPHVAVRLEMPDSRLFDRVLLGRLPADFPRDSEGRCGSLVTVDRRFPQFENRPLGGARRQ
jgi:hypothetical protein